MKRSAVSKPLLLVVTAFVTLVWVVPLVMVVGAGAKTTEQFQRDGFFGLSGSLAQLWRNTVAAADLSDLWRGFGNSVGYGIVGAALAVLFSALAAYGLVWLRLKFSFLLFMLIYAGTVLPFQMYMIPLNQTYKQVGLYNTQVGMLIFYVTICIPFCVFVFRSYFMGLPEEVLEAAKLDGASSMRIFAQVIVPLAASPALLLFLTQFTWIWNDLLFGQVLTTSAEARPIMPAIAMLSGNVAMGTVPERMAGALMASVPALLLFVVLRKKFMQGFALNSR